jgi:two-component system response regulator (stage 0 sporulation protein F)
MYARGSAIDGKVLVVEDDDAIRTMLVTVLDLADYDVRGVIDAEEALAILEDWRPDVIILDLFMPGMGGREFLRRRSALDDLATIPVIVVTATTASLPPAERLGVRAVLQKPHDVQQLLGLIAQTIQPSAGSGR